jgi:uncharacterized repeat protein (TIGR01451 family)
VCRHSPRAAVLVIALGLPWVGLQRLAGQVEIPALPEPVPPPGKVAVPAHAVPLGGAASRPLTAQDNERHAEAVKQEPLPPAFRVLTPTAPAAPIVPAGFDQRVPGRLPGPGSFLPSLTLAKHGPAAVNLGQPVAYEVVVRNVGAVAATGLRIEDDLPPGVRLLGTVPGAMVQGQHLTWALALLPPGQESRFRIEVLPAVPGALASRATVSIGAAAAEAQTQVNAPGVTVRVVGPEEAALGQAVALAIHLANLDARPRKGLVLRVRFGEGLRHEGGKEIESDPFDLDGAGHKDIDLHVQAVGAGRQITDAWVIAPDGLQVRDQAVINVAGPEVAPSPARPRPSLVIHKSGPQRPVVGEKCDYHLEVENRGMTEIADVNLYDRLPPGMDFLAAGNGGIFDATTRSVQWRIGTLGPRQQRGMTVRLLARSVGEQVNQVWVLGEPNQEAHLTATMQIDSQGSHGLLGIRKNK